MATIVILEHAHQASANQDYLLYALARNWRDWGHTILMHRGLDDPPEADLAIQNVDLTIIPDEYRRLAERYPKVINGAVLDISKRRFSQLLLSEDSDYEGPVIVKTDANSRGKMDQHIVRKIETSLRAPKSKPISLNHYHVYDSLWDVPDSAWKQQALIVEKFLPEKDDNGYYLRHWVFCGDRERSVRYRAAVPVIKSRDLIERLPAEVPDEIRAWRERLRVDFGKFDYVLHNGEYLLLDVNTTPTTPAQEDTNHKAVREAMARGIDVFLEPAQRIVPQSSEPVAASASGMSD